MLQLEPSLLWVANTALMTLPMFNFWEYLNAYLKFTVHGCKQTDTQTDIHMHLAICPAGVEFAQARLNHSALSPKQNFCSEKALQTFWCMIAL